MQKMEIKNISEEMLNAPVDSGANIKIVKLTGNDTLGVFAAEIAPKSGLNPHYHKYWIETYQIFKGTGIMKIGELAQDAINWLEEFSVKDGDCFTIAEGSIHQLINDAELPLQVVFSCPVSHLTHDRHFI